MSIHRKLTPFTGRWLIRGTFTTSSPLHIGSGEQLDHPVLKSDDGRAVKFNAVMRDREGRPFIPGSSWRGPLRAWMLKAFDPQKVEALLGHQQKGASSTDSVGGKVAFHEARITTAPTLTFAVGGEPPFWDATKLTGIEASVAIQRRTRTAADKKLFNTEFVPAGVSFTVELTGQNLSDEEVAMLLRALQEFNITDTDAITLGAEAANGWGRMTWGLGNVHHLTDSDVAAWLLRFQNPPPPPAALTYGHRTTALGTDRKVVMEAKATALTPNPTTKNQITLELELYFDGPLLVRRSKKPKAPNTPNEPDAEPRLTTDGKVLIPERSMRGAIRSQAERILRTLLNPEPADKKVAPDPSLNNEVLRRKADDSLDFDALSLAARIFGAGSWKSPISFSPFVSTKIVSVDDDNSLISQEFVAIDRFTGGAASSRTPEGKLQGAKFKFQYVWKPIIAGRISFDLGRWGKSGISDQALGLLALVVRDGIEGDVTFGMGTSKGFGTCRWIVRSVTFPDQTTFKNAGEAAKSPLPDLSTEQQEIVRRYVNCVPGRKPIPVTPQPSAD